MKVVASTTLEEADMGVVQRFADRHDMSFAAALRIVVKRGLPGIEAEVLGAQFAGKPVGPAPRRPRPAAQEVGA